MENKINNIINNSIINISNLIKSIDIFETPKMVDNDIIIPVSNISISLLLGGGEYGKTGLFIQKDYPATCGNISFIKKEPKFLLIKKGNNYELLKSTDNQLDRILSLVEKIIK